MHIVWFWNGHFVKVHFHCKSIPNVNIIFDALVSYFIVAESVVQQKQVFEEVILTTEKCLFKAYKNKLNQVKMIKIFDKTSVECTCELGN